jgi:hypothetical protein
MSDWRPYEPSRDAEIAARKHRPGPHSESCVCGGEGWLWGHELRNGEPYPTDTRYRCDRSPEDEDDVLTMDDIEDALRQRHEDAKAAAPALLARPGRFR